MENHKRPLWSDNYIYILAAIGCAAGLGNLWRFSMLAFENGGAAFVLALLISNIFIVYPLLMAESAIGQKYRLSAPQAFSKFAPGFSWIQWLAIFASLFILMYYVPIMAWAVKYFVLAFSGEFLLDPSNYFTSNIIHITDSVTMPGPFLWSIFFALLVSYIAVYFSLRRDVNSLSKVIVWTATLPFLLLLVLLIRSVTLPGAIEGLKVLFLPDWSQLSNFQLWQAAIGQSFFSASLALGYFMVSASHRSKDQDIAKSSIWILVGNFAVSLLAGITVFGTLGFMAGEQGVTVAEVAKGGPMLVFSVLPTAIAAMPTAKIFMAVLLFLVVITLAIDSVFGLVELTVGAFHDNFKLNYESVLIRTLVITFIGSLPFMFGAGLYYLDILDHYVGGYLLMLIGMLEAAVIAYIVGPNKVRELINTKNSAFKVGVWFDYLLYLIPILLLFILINVIQVELQGPYEGYPWFYQYAAGIVPLSVVVLLSIWFGLKTDK